MNYKEISDRTKLKLDSENIQRGDIFHEMYSVWFYIIGKVDNDKWLVLYRYGGNLFNYYLLTSQEISNKFRYGSGVVKIIVPRPYDKSLNYWLDFSCNDIQKCNDYYNLFLSQLPIVDKRDFLLEMIIWEDIE